MTSDPHERLLRALVSAARSELPPAGAKARALARIEEAESAWMVRLATSVLAVALVVTTLGPRPASFASFARFAPFERADHASVEPAVSTCVEDAEAPIDACGTSAGVALGESGSGSSSGGAPGSSSG